VGVQVDGRESFSFGGWLLGNRRKKRGPEGETLIAKHLGRVLNLASLCREVTGSPSAALTPRRRRFPEPVEPPCSEQASSFALLM